MEKPWHHVRPLQQEGTRAWQGGGRHLPGARSLAQINTSLPTAKVCWGRRGDTSETERAEQPPPAPPHTLHPEKCCVLSGETA